jgi:hypothetical protein
MLDRAAALVAAVLDYVRSSRSSDEAIALAQAQIAQADEILLFSVSERAFERVTREAAAMDDKIGALLAVQAVFVAVLIDKVESFGWVSLAAFGVVTAGTGFLFRIIRYAAFDVLRFRTKFVEAPRETRAAAIKDLLEVAESNSQITVSRGKWFNALLILTFLAATFAFAEKVVNSHHDGQGQHQRVPATCRHQDQGGQWREGCLARRRA